jgi:hypothetical protein
MNKIMQLYRDNAERPKQFTNLVNIAGDSATIYLYDMITQVVNIR